MRNKYVSTIRNGHLDYWTGPNPDKDASALKAALARAEMLRENGIAAYAVVVTQILDGDGAKSEGATA